jgi:hypothetical protein
MQLPFTTEQFIAVFERYNTAVWPAQLVLLALAIAAVVLALRPAHRSGIIVSVILALLWTWTGLAYHLQFFSRINPAAPAFAMLTVGAALAFLWWGAIRRTLKFGPGGGWRAWLGGVLIGYALIVYPALSWVAGHRYPAAPTFGLPCPTTIFTIGILAFAKRPGPWQVHVMPFAWSAIGAQAALLLSMPQDLGLAAAGLASAALALTARSCAAGRAEGSRVDV